MHQHFLILDLETTGLSPEKGDTIIDIGAIICGKNGIEKTFQSLVHPGTVEVPQFVHQLTGISQEMLADAPEKGKVLEEFRAFLGEETYIVIGHNISFDTNFLNHHGFHFSESYNVDTNDFSTLFFPEITSHSLEVLAATFQIEHTEKHRALGDVLACYELLKILHHSFLQLPQEVQQHIHALLEKSLWGGKHFFSLEVDPTSNLSYKFPDTHIAPLSLEGNALLLQKALTKHICADGETTFFALPPFLPHTQMIQEACAQAHATQPFLVIGTQQSIEAFKALQSEEILYIDKNKSLFSRIKLRTSVIQYTSGEDMLLRIRDILGQFPEDFISLYTVQLTYKERSYCQRFLLEQEDIHSCHEALTSFLQKRKIIVTTWYHFFEDALSSHLQEYKQRILLGGMEIEYGIVESHRSFLSLDGLRYSMQNHMHTDEQHIYEGYLTIMSQIFERIQHKLRKQSTMQAELSLFTEEYKDFQVYTQRLIESMGEHAHNSTLLAQFTAYVRPFLEYAEENYYYCKSYNNQITFFKEPKDITPYKEVLIQHAHISIIDSLYDENFTYYISPTAYYTLEDTDIESIFSRTLELHVLNDTEEIRSLEKSDLDFFTHHVPKEEKSLVLCNTGAKLEKLFEALLHTYSADSIQILAYGKSGGTHKVNHNMRGSKNAILFAKFQDLASVEPEAQVTHIFLHSLPFPNIQGMYYDAHYINTFASFTIPITTKQLFETLSYCTGLNHRVHVYLYDSRMYTKDYGKEILQSILKY